MIWSSYTGLESSTLTKKFYRFNHQRYEVCHFNQIITTHVCMSHLIGKKTLLSNIKQNTEAQYSEKVHQKFTEHTFRLYLKVLWLMRICITRAGQRNSQESINSFYHVGPEDRTEIRLRADIFACWATSLVLQNTFDKPKPLAKQRLQCYCLFCFRTGSLLKTGCCIINLTERSALSIQKGLYSSFSSTFKNIHSLGSVPSYLLSTRDII